MEGYFEGTGHTLLLAENGKQAVEMTEEHHPDLILMDIRMPVMGGIEATKIIKGISDVPVIALTASSLKDQRERFLEICDAHLGKPVSRSTLAQTLKEFLPSKEPTVAAVSPKAEAGSPEEEEAAPEVKAKWQELVDLLEYEKDGVWHTLREIPNMAEVETFAASLHELAAEYMARPLENYAQRLLQQVVEFDVEHLPGTLAAFPEIIENIRRKGKTP